MWVRGCPIKSACLTLQTSRNPGSSSGGGPWWLRAATKVLPPRQPRAGARRPPPGEYKSKKISKECWTRQSLRFQICGYRHNWVLLKDVRNMHFYFGHWNSFNAPFIVMVSQARGILSMPFHCHGFVGQRALSMSFHCHGFPGQWDSFNVFSLSWLHRAVGSFKIRHCHGFTGQWDFEGSGILYFHVFSLSWSHRAIVMVKKINITKIKKVFNILQVVPGRARGGSFRRKKNYIAKKEFAYRMCARRPTSAMPKPFLCCEPAFCCSMVVMWPVLMHVMSFDVVVMSFDAMWLLVLCHVTRCNAMSCDVRSCDVPCNGHVVCSKWFCDNVVIQSIILYYKVLLCTTKYYSSTTLYYNVLLQYYSVQLQRTQEKLHAAVARSTFWSQNAKKLTVSDHFLKLRCGKIARRCSERYIFKSKC